MEIIWFIDEKTLENKKLYYKDFNYETYPAPKLTLDDLKQGLLNRIEQFDKYKYSIKDNIDLVADFLSLRQLVELDVSFWSDYNDTSGLFEYKTYVRSFKYHFTDENNLIKYTLENNIIEDNLESIRHGHYKINKVPTAKLTNIDILKSLAPIDCINLYEGRKIDEERIVYSFNKESYTLPILKYIRSRVKEKGHPQNFGYNLNRKSNTIEFYFETDVNQYHRKYILTEFRGTLDLRTLEVTYFIERSEFYSSS